MAKGRGIQSDATRRAEVNTAPPGRAGRWREGETRPQPSGVERGYTLASSVAARGSADERHRSGGGDEKLSTSVPPDFAAQLQCTPDMSVNLWGASPLYENGN